MCRYTVYLGGALYLLPEASGHGIHTRYLSTLFHYESIFFLELELPLPASQPSFSVASDSKLQLANLMLNSTIRFIVYGRL